MKPNSFQCFYCDNWFPKHQETKDHFYPKWTGATLHRNTVLACGHCNGLKGGRFPTEEEVERYRVRFGHAPRFGPKPAKERPRKSPLEKELRCRLLEGLST